MSRFDRFHWCCASHSERDPSKKTMASKVLGAIALERVTGREARSVASDAVKLGNKTRR
jgi:hypothetical protein